MPNGVYYEWEQLSNTIRVNGAQNPWGSGSGYTAAYVERAPRPMPEPKQGALIEFAGIHCVVLYGDYETIRISPLGVPNGFYISRKVLGDRWKPIILQEEATNAQRV